MANYPTLVQMAGKADIGVLETFSTTDPKKRTINKRLPPKILMDVFEIGYGATAKDKDYVKGVFAEYTASVEAAFDYFTENPLRGLSVVAAAIDAGLDKFLRSYVSLINPDTLPDELKKRLKAEQKKAEARGWKNFDLEDLASLDYRRFKKETESEKAAKAAKKKAKKQRRR